MADKLNYLEEVQQAALTGLLLANLVENRLWVFDCTFIGLVLIWATPIQYFVIVSTRALMLPMSHQHLTDLQRTNIKRKDYPN